MVVLWYDLFLSLVEPIRKASQNSSRFNRKVNELKVQSKAVSNRTFFSLPIPSHPSLGASSL